TAAAVCCSAWFGWDRGACQAVRPTVADHPATARRPAMGSDQLNVIPPADTAALDDRRVNPDVPPVLLDGSAEHRRVLRQAALAKGRHDAARAGPVDPQLHAAERERPPGPAVLDEPVGPVRRLDHEVRPEPRDFKTAGG